MNKQKERADYEVEPKQSVLRTVSDLISFVVELPQRQKVNMLQSPNKSEIPWQFHLLIKLTEFRNIFARIKSCQKFWYFILLNFWGDLVSLVLAYKVEWNGETEDGNQEYDNEPANVNEYFEDNVD